MVKNENDSYHRSIGLYKNIRILLNMIVISVSADSAKTPKCFANLQRIH